MQNIKLTDADFAATATVLGLETALLQAVHEVETSGRSGFLEPGKPIILFEGHIFWNQLTQRGIKPEQYTKGNENILYPQWTKKHYKGLSYEYARLAKALRIHEEAALASASWGMFQIMGFNYALCGFPTIGSFVTAMCKSAAAQLEAFSHYLQSTHLDTPLRTHDWHTFARRYNGPAYRLNHYAEKLANAYRKYKDNSSKSMVTINPSS